MSWRTSPTHIYLGLLGDEHIVGPWGIGTRKETTNNKQNDQTNETNRWLEKNKPNENTLELKQVRKECLLKEHFAYSQPFQTCTHRVHLSITLTMTVNVFLAESLFAAIHWFILMPVVGERLAMTDHLKYDLSFSGRIITKVCHLGLKKKKNFGQPSGKMFLLTSKSEARCQGRYDYEWLHKQLVGALCNCEEIRWLTFDITSSNI